jgi:acyl-CoA oxidase
MASPLEKARASATVNPALITEMVYGGAAAVQRRREITALFEEDPDFCKVGRPFLNHSNRYLASIAKCQAFHLKCEALGLTDPMELRWAYQAVDEILPTEYVVVVSAIVTIVD